LKHADPYKEAMRYIENAELQFKQAGIDGKFYVDDKYVKSASGIAFSGLLKALDFLFDIKDVPKRWRLPLFQVETSRIKEKCDAI
jgi:hypothetical protein